MFDTFSCFLNKFHCHIFSFVSHLPNSRSWQLSQRNSWSKPPYSVCCSAPSHSDSASLSSSFCTVFIWFQLCILHCSSVQMQKLHLQHVCVIYISRIFVMSICWCTVQLLQCCCRVIVARFLCTVTTQLIHSFNRGGHCAFGLVWPILNDGLVSTIMVIMAWKSQLTKNLFWLNIDLGLFLSMNSRLDENGI